MDKKEKLQAVIAKGKKVLIKKRMHVLLLGLVIIALYSMSKIHVDTIAFECKSLIKSNKSSLFEELNPERWVFQKFIINANNNPNDFMPIKFLTYVPVSTTATFKLPYDCKKGLGRINCVAYIDDFSRKIINDEYDANIKKNQEIIYLVIEQVDLNDYDSKFNYTRLEFNENDKAFRISSDKNKSAVCKQTGIKF